MAASETRDGFTLLGPTTIIYAHALFSLVRTDM
jgi:hypothetical protein